MLKDKNILFITHSYNSFVKDPIEAVAKEFKKVYVLVRYQPIAELSSILPIPYIRSQKKFSRQYSIDLKNLPNNVEIIEIPLWYLPFRFLYKYVGNLHARKAIDIINKKNIHFDIIHAHFGWSAGYAGMKIKQKFNKPLVITAHGYDVYSLPFINKDWEKSMREVYDSADQVITVSGKNKQLLEKIGIHKASVIPNGYSSNLFYKKDKNECRKNLGLPADKKIILSIGNLVMVKGYDVLIKSLNILKDKNIDFLFLHIGSGLEEKSIKSLVRKLNLSDHVRFLGNIPHNELVDWYGACDIFVSSSLSEGNPTVMFEALGCGRPFIGTEVGGVPEVINSPDYGILAKPGDHDILADNIIAGLEKKWSEDFIIDYANRFSWEKEAEYIIKIYNRIIDK